MTKDETARKKFHRNDYRFVVFCFLLLHSASIDIRLLTSAEELAAWATFVRTCPQGSLWQSQEWKSYQEALGRETRVYGGFQAQKMIACALIVIDRTTGNLATWEAPRGPIYNVSFQELTSSLIDRIIDDAKKEGCLNVYLSPLEKLEPRSYQLVSSSRHTQPEATRILSLALAENDLLAQMKPKGRYNIRLAERHTIDVREETNVTAFHALLKRTGDRDRFGIHSESHYRAFLERLPGAFLLLAYHPRVSNHEPIAGLLGVVWGATGIYYYGASDERQRALMAPYLLQWEAMKRCKAAGCTHYDLLGVAPPNTDGTHPWAGITNFKEKFGGALVSYPREQQAVLRPMLWKLLKLKRKILG